MLPGQTAQIIVQAVNGNLQGVASEPIQFTMPLVARANTAETVAAIPAVVPATNGSNGHTNGSRMPALA